MAYGMLISKLSRSPTINHNFVLLEEVVNLETYIVTGAAGFLGCNLTERLMQEMDAHIYAVVRPNSPHNARLAPSERLTPSYPPTYRNTRILMR